VTKLITISRKRSATSVDRRIAAKKSREPAGATEEKSTAGRSKSKPPRASAVHGAPGPRLSKEMRQLAACLLEYEDIFLGAHLFQDLWPDAYCYFA
jgi:hypothetical protein